MLAGAGIGSLAGAGIGSLLGANVSPQVLHEGVAQVLHELRWQQRLRLQRLNHPQRRSRHELRLQLEQDERHGLWQRTLQGWSHFEHEEHDEPPCRFQKAWAWSPLSRKAATATTPSTNNLRMVEFLPKNRRRKVCPQPKHEAIPRVADPVLRSLKA